MGSSACGSSGVWLRTGSRGVQGKVPLQVSLQAGAWQSPFLWDKISVPGVFSDTVRLAQALPSTKGTSGFARARQATDISLSSSLCSRLWKDSGQSCLSLTAPKSAKPTSSGLGSQNKAQRQGHGAPLHTHLPYVHHFGFGRKHHAVQGVSKRALSPESIASSQQLKKGRKD